MEITHISIQMLFSSEILVVYLDFIKFVVEVDLHFQVVPNIRKVFQ